MPSDGKELGHFERAKLAIRLARIEREHARIERDLGDIEVREGNSLERPPNACVERSLPCELTRLRQFQGFAGY